MPSENSYNEFLKQNFGKLIDALELSDMQKNFLRSRWLDQVMWMEGKAAITQKRYYALRLTAIIGGIIVPALVGLKLGDDASVIITWLIFTISLIVAISVAVEEFFHYGERWRHYRRTVELLKIEGWQFFQLCGIYQNCKTQSEAYPIFATRVEDICRQDVDVFVTEVAKEKKDKSEQKEK